MVALVSSCTLHKLVTSCQYYSTYYQIKNNNNKNKKIGYSIFYDSKRMQYRLEKTSKQTRNIQKKKNITYRYIKQQACQIKKENWKHYQKPTSNFINPKVMYTRYYLLRWHIQGDGSQVHFRVRLDAGQHEKKAYEQYVLSIRASIYNTRQQRNRYCYIINGMTNTMGTKEVVLRGGPSSVDGALLYKVPSKSTGKNSVTNVYCFYLQNLKRNTSLKYLTPEIEVIYY